MMCSSTNNRTSFRQGLVLVLMLSICESARSFVLARTCSLRSSRTYYHHHHPKARSSSRLTVRQLHAVSLPDAQHVLQTYSDLLVVHPVITKATTASALTCLGDAIAQYGAHVQQQQSDDKKDFIYDTRRGASFLVFGALYTGIFQHYWFAYLNAHVIFTTADPSYLPPMGDLDPAFLTAATKVVINQGGAIAGLYMPTFLALTAWLGDMTVEQGVQRARTLYGPLIRRNWLFWMPTQWVQFALIPDAWHIPYLSLMSLVWTTILSTIGNVAKPSAAAGQQQQQQLTKEDDPASAMQKMKGRESVADRVAVVTATDDEDVTASPVRRTNTTESFGRPPVLLLTNQRRLRNNDTDISLASSAAARAR